MPALLVSTAAGVLVTRAAGADLGSQVGSQLVKSPRALRYAAAVMGALASLPGLPAIPFLGPRSLAYTLARRAEKKPPMHCPRPTRRRKRPEERAPARLLALDALTFEVGYALLTLIDPAKVQLPAIPRCPSGREGHGHRAALAAPVHNLRLDANEYRSYCAASSSRAAKALDGSSALFEPERRRPHIDGIEAKDPPAFGLPAVCCCPSSALTPRAAATAGRRLLGVTTHLSELFAATPRARRPVRKFRSCWHGSKEAPKLVEDTFFYRHAGRSGSSW